MSYLRIHLKFLLKEVYQGYTEVDIFVHTSQICKFITNLTNKKQCFLCVHTNKNDKNSNKKDNAILGGGGEKESASISYF